LAIPDAPLRESMFQEGTQSMTDIWFDWFNLATVTYRVDFITRVTSAYTIILNDHTIFVNTNSGAVTVNLPKGIQGTYYRIVNTGTSGNNVTLTPFSGENIDGSSASVTLADGVSKPINFDSTDGWF